MTFGFELASIALVVLGVSGELVVGIVSADRNAELRNKSRLLVGFVNQKAADADARAGEADKLAGKANEHAALLNLEAAKLRERIAIQGPRPDLLRGVSRDLLISKLKRFAGQRVEVRYSIVDIGAALQDTVATCMLLETALASAKWEITAPGSLGPVGGTGISVLVSPDCPQVTLRAADSLVQALRGCSIQVSDVSKYPVSDWAHVGFLPPNRDPDTVIMVGVFPHP
jgi:hypothetical protein